MPCHSKFQKQQYSSCLCFSEWIPAVFECLHSWEIFTKSLSPEHFPQISLVFKFFSAKIRESVQTMANALTWAVVFLSSCWWKWLRLPTLSFNFIWQCWLAPLVISLFMSLNLTFFLCSCSFPHLLLLFLTEVTTLSTISLHWSSRNNFKVLCTLSKWILTVCKFFLSCGYKEWKNWSHSSLCLSLQPLPLLTSHTLFGNKCM